jgi:hypothetical protein
MRHSLTQQKSCSTRKSVAYLLWMDHGHLIGVISESDIFRMVIQHGLEERARQSEIVSHFWA